MSESLWKRGLSPAAIWAVLGLSLLGMGITMGVLLRDPPAAKRLNDMPIEERRKAFRQFQQRTGNP
jgi:hypothetical protein